PGQQGPPCRRRRRRRVGGAGREEPGLTVSFAVTLSCRACGRPARSPCAWRCDCGEPFGLLTAEEAEGVRLDDLPVPDLGHGDTPLIPSPAHDSGDVYL